MSATHAGPVPAFTGGPAGVTAFDAADCALVPAALIADTWKV